MTTSEIKESGERMAATKYLVGHLAVGNTLSRLMLDILDFESGSIVAVSAVPTEGAARFDFGHGHASPASTASQTLSIGGTSFTMRQTPNARVWLAQFIRAALVRDGDLCLLENALARDGDRRLERAKSRLVFSGGEVYHALVPADKDTEAFILSAIAEAESLPVFVGAVGCSPWTAGQNTLNSTVTTEQLTQFAKTIRFVFVGAYDGEGYMVWQGQT